MEKKKEKTLDSYFKQYSEEHRGKWMIVSQTKLQEK